MPYEINTYKRRKYECANVHEEMLLSLSHPLTAYRDAGDAKKFTRDPFDLSDADDKNEDIPPKRN